MKKAFVACVVLSLLSNTEGTPPRPTHNLIILLDYGQSEELLRSADSSVSSKRGPSINGLAKLGAITSTLIPALYQKVAPILVSKSLLYSLLMRKKIFEDCITKEISHLARLYKRQVITEAPSLGLFKQHCQYAKRMYEQIKKELSGISQESTVQEKDRAMRALASKNKYLEHVAPQTLQLYSGERRSIKENLHKELQAYTLCYYAPVSDEHYTIKEVSSELVLLVPRMLGTQQELSYNNTPTVSAFEKNLGLKVNHLKDISLDQLLIPTPITYGIDLAEKLKTVCVTKKEGGKQVWSVYLSGHGLPSYPEHRKIDHLKKLQSLYSEEYPRNTKNHLQQRALSYRLDLIQKELRITERALKEQCPYHEKVICSISVVEFTRLLHLLNQDLTTSLFLYTSCYGGGEHLTIPYRDTTRVLNYDCIAGSLSDAVSFQTTPMLFLPPYRNSNNRIEGIHHEAIDCTLKQLAPFSSIHFEDFFSMARRRDRNALRLIHCLHPYIENGKLLEDSLENIALERPAGKTAFRVIGDGEILVPASSSILDESVEVALLEQAHYGTIKLGTYAPSFISVCEGPASHVIDYLDGSQQTIPEILMSFLQLPTLSTPKLFWIKQVTCKKETVPPFFLPLQNFKELFKGRENRLITLRDLVITRNIPTTDSISHRASISIYFTDEHNRTWYVPVKHSGSWGNCSKIEGYLAHKELHTLFPEVAAGPRKTH